MSTLNDLLSTPLGVDETALAAENFVKIAAARGMDVNSMTKEQILGSFNKMAEEVAREEAAEELADKLQEASTAADEQGAADEGGEDDEEKEAAVAEAIKLGEIAGLSHIRVLEKYAAEGAEAADDEEEDDDEPKPEELKEAALTLLVAAGEQEKTAEDYGLLEKIASAGETEKLKEAAIELWETAEGLEKNAAPLLSKTQAVKQLLKSLATGKAATGDVIGRMNVLRMMSPGQKALLGAGAAGAAGAAGGAGYGGYRGVKALTKKSSAEDILQFLAAGQEKAAGLGQEVSSQALGGTAIGALLGGAGGALAGTGAKQRAILAGLAALGGGAAGAGAGTLSALEGKVLGGTGRGIKKLLTKKSSAEAELLEKIGEYMDGGVGAGETSWDDQVAARALEKLGERGLL